MLGRLLTAFTAVLSGVLAAPVPPAEPGWPVDLSRGAPAGVAFTGGALRLTEPTGLVTLPGMPAPVPVGRVGVTLDATVPPGASVQVEVRGRLPNGRWTEWLPAPATGPGVATGPVTRVQPRARLSGPGRPELRRLWLRTEPATDLRVDGAPEPVSYGVYATREGLRHSRTANGHRIGKHDLFVALPSKRALSSPGGGEYTVKVCAASGYCAWAPVWDVGPWNIADDYWNADRERFQDLPQGLPQAEAAYANGHNHGKDGSGRRVLNPAGIDLSDALFADLKLTGTARVSVTYLWTAGPLSTIDTESGTANGQRANDDDGLFGDALHDPLGKTYAEGEADGVSDSDGDPVTVRAAPAPDSAAVGSARQQAGVAVQCATPNGWLRIGDHQYLPAGVVRLNPALDLRGC